MLNRRELICSGVALAAAPAALAQSIPIQLMIKQKWEMFAATGQEVALSAMPSSYGFVQVFVNGLLTLEGEDYARTDMTITFTKLQIAPSALVQVYYWIVA